MKATVREFAGQLGKLALHYWRPDFTPDQAKLMYGDFITDLDGVTAQELADACQEWRLDPLNKFFPTPGMLRELCLDRLNDRRRRKVGAEYLLTLLAEGAPAGTDRSDPVGKKLAELSEKMRAESETRASVQVVSDPHIPKVSTARSATDAAELKDRLARKGVTI